VICKFHLPDGAYIEVLTARKMPKEGYY